MKRSTTTAKVRAKNSVLLGDVRKSVSEILGKPFTDRVDHQLFRPEQKILARWAADCAEHVLHYFEEKYPNDKRPRWAIKTLRAWTRTGVFSMRVIRKASLGAHASAKGKKDRDAVFASHAAGQAVATAHVVTHAFGSSVYAIRAVTAHFDNLEKGMKERDWQLQCLRKYASGTKIRR